MKYTTDDKKQLVNEIGYLSKDEHMEIFKLIKNSTNQYTKNDNGIFINLSILDDKIIHKLYNFVKFCIDNRKTLEKKDEIIQLEKDKMFNKVKEEIEGNEEYLKQDDNLENVNKPDIKNLENEDDVDEDNIEESEGFKITLKKSKPKYTGTKAKLIKNYKQNSNNIQNIIYKNSKNDDKKNNEYNIGEENYEDYLDEDKQDNNEDLLEDDLLENEDTEDKFDMDYDDDENDVEENDNEGEDYDNVEEDN